ncbi:hypothetical protein ACFOOM_15360 [Streptomyces echinoruber]|uniref:Cas10/Cmr2 second palm domain-containing protein n=1 Tax=Streptomyces echinoruber TaxID=68898 RepID=A0A918VAA1_9ACTN|nr:hypothetical protein [Streptomyces echinoruber]GGZ83513.1 hypothetical protein GCM10010389_21710 [Streptomyces echinoruber]
MTVTGEEHARQEQRPPGPRHAADRTRARLGHAHVYIDIGFVRIQRYLARTAKLRGRRAASDHLARATDSEAVAAALPPGLAGLAEANPEAGRADGVISLRLAPHAPHAPDSLDARDRLVQDVIDAVFAGLREEFPGAELEAVWGTGESYLAARMRDMVPRQARGEVRVELPAPAEFPLAQPCRLCHTDPAAGTAQVPGERREQAVCPDCARRLAHDRRALARERRGDGDASAESRLQKAIGCAPAPDTLQELAEHTLDLDHTRQGAGKGTGGGAAKGGGSGAHSRDGGPRGTQLATVYIDGNAVGAFFRALASAASASAELRRAKETISAELAEATVMALHLATEQVMEGPARTGPLLVVPHVVGGDDVLVSLPADRAWTFTLTYLEMFHDLLAETTGPVLRLLPAPRPEPPTASAGIVFAHSTYPMNLVVDLAEERLTRAKRATSGAACSVDFVDVTADGPHGTADPALPLAALDARTRAALAALARTPAAHRRELAAAVRAHGPLIAARTVGARVGHRQLADAFDLFLPPDDTGTHDFRSFPGSSGSLDSPGSPPPLISLSHALRIARWWPTS